MMNREALPSAFGRVKRKILVDNSLRLEVDNKISITQYVKKFLDGKPVSGYLDEVPATEEEIIQLLSTADDLSDYVLTYGSDRDCESEVLEGYDTADNIDTKSLRFMRTLSFQMISGKKDIGKTFINLNSTDTSDMKEKYGCSFLSEFDEDKYYLDIEFAKDENGNVPIYTISRSIDKMTKDDFEISKFLLQNAQSEVREKLANI